VVVIAGHGTGYHICLWDAWVTHGDFVANYLNKINDNGLNSSPIERLDVLSTICYAGALIDDFRDNFHNLRRQAWPNARHISILTGCDYNEESSSFFAVPLLIGLRTDGQDVPDLNGDQVLSIYEYFDHSAKNDLINPPDPYTPGVPETIYVQGESYLPGFCIDGCCEEHPLYYEWNGATLHLSINNEERGRVVADPEPNVHSHLQYKVGTEVALQAVPEPNMLFLCWKIAKDPCCVGGVNDFIFDANNPVNLVLNEDVHMTACFRDPIEPFFKCSSNVAPLLPVMLGVLGLFVVVRRTR
jgi:hypothetical protein